MAIYRFKISFEDYDDVMREIAIRSNQTFEQLHQIIHQSTGYNPGMPSSFYVSNDQWIKKEEITLLQDEKKIEKGVALMANTPLSNFIEDPHQKFYYTYNFKNPIYFHVELIKILLADDSNTPYPYIVKSVGQAPKITAATILPSSSSMDSSMEYDFLNEVDFDPRDAEEIEIMNEMGITQKEDQDQDDQESDDFLDQQDGDEDIFDREDY